MGTLNTTTEPFTDDDDRLREFVAQAEAAPLLPALALATGDLSLLRDDLRPDPTRVIEPDGGLGFAQLDEIRSLALDALRRFRDAGCPPPPPPDPETLRRLMAFLVGDDNVVPYEGVLTEELGLDGDLRAPDWHKEAIAPDRPFTAAVIGAGMSGLLAAHRLDQAGVDVVVVEKNPDVGGTWFDNTYPGCRVDVPNALYSYSFAQAVWPQHFSDQAVLLDYFRRFADDFGVRERIRFSTEVTDVVLDEATGRWTLHMRHRDGSRSELTADVVVSAVGQLNQPSYPAIEGRDEFEGPSFHSAGWDHDIDLRGRRVAVIGTGASAVQFVPPVAAEAGEVFVFQRTPNWLVPTPDYHDEVSDGMRWLLEHVPGYAHWYRLWIFWRSHEGLLPTCEVDPDWPHQDRSVSATNDLVRMLLDAYLQGEFADAPEMLDRVLPQYPPVAKRVLRDNGIWARTLKQDHVHLVTTPIDRITPKGVRTSDGVEHEVDVIVYGTGFQASRFLTPMRVVGRAGADLHETWAGEARAYLGITVAGFPNLFLLYGPNTNIVINGSIIYFSECEVRYLVDCVRLLLSEGRQTLDVRPEVQESFCSEVDAKNRAMTWGASSVNSWYKNDSGRVAQNWPFSLLEYWERTRRVDPADYVVS